MSLNSLGVMIYGSVIMYILMYWILWFFKVPYYKKMYIHTDQFLQIILSSYFIIISVAMIVEMGIIFHDGKESPPFTFVGSVIIFIIALISYLPEWVTNLRNKIPNRWEE